MMTRTCGEHCKPHPADILNSFFAHVHGTKDGCSDWAASSDCDETDDSRADGGREDEEGDDGDGDGDDDGDEGGEGDDDDDDDDDEYDEADGNDDKKHAVYGNAVDCAFDGHDHEDGGADGDMR